MALDKLVDSSQLDSDLTSVADAIRAKSGGSNALAFPSGFVSEIQAIPSGGGLTDDIKQALLQIAQKVAYIDDQGAAYYQDLYNALYPPADLVSITAVYTQSGTVYPTTPLDDLKTDLVVTGTYDDQSTATIPASGYTLTGTLTVGTSTVTVTSGGKTTTFSVTVTAAHTLSSITAVYTQSGTVWSDDILVSLKSDLVVTAAYTDSTTETVSPADYTLSGTLDSATSTITVSYGGKTATFTVAVTLVGSTNYASSDLNNLTRVVSTGRNGITDGVVWYKALDSTDISSWTSWIADPKPTLWSSLENKRVRIRASIRSANWTGEVADDNRVTLHMAVYKNASVTSLGSDNRCYTWGLDISYKPNTDWDVFEKIMTLDPESASRNPGTLTSSSTVGFASFAETLHTVEIRSIEILEVLN